MPQLTLNLYLSSYNDLVFSLLEHTNFVRSCKPLRSDSTNALGNLQCKIHNPQQCKNLHPDEACKQLWANWGILIRYSNYSLTKL